MTSNQPPQWGQGQYGHNQGGWPGYPQQPIPQPPRPHRRRTTTILVIGAVIAVIAIVAVVTSLLSAPSSSTNANGPSSPDLAKSSPKSNVVVQKLNQGPAFTYGSTAVFDACSLLPLSVLTDNKIQLNPELSIQRDYVDHNVAQEQAIQLPHEISTCSYPIQPSGSSARAGIVVSVNQSPISEVRTGPSGFTSSTQHTASGLTVYIGKVQNTAIGLVTAQGASVEVNLGELSDPYQGVPVADLLTKLTDAAAAQMAKGPTAPSSFSYGDSHQNAKPDCAAFTTDMFQQYTSKPDSGIVSETVGISESETFDGPNYTYNVETTCIRQSTPPGGITATGDKYIVVNIDNYRNVGSAKYDVDQVQCNPNSSVVSISGPPQQVPDKVGDGATCVNVSSKPAYHFRVGANAVSIGDQSKPVISDLAQYGTKVTPLAKLIAAGLK